MLSLLTEWRDLHLCDGESAALCEGALTHLLDLFFVEFLVSRTYERGSSRVARRCAGLVRFSQRYARSAAALSGRPGTPCRRSPWPPCASRSPRPASAGGSFAAERDRSACRPIPTASAWPTSVAAAPRAAAEAKTSKRHGRGWCCRTCGRSAPRGELRLHRATDRLELPELLVFERHLARRKTRVGAQHPLAIKADFLLDLLS